MSVIVVFRSQRAQLSALDAALRPKQVEHIHIIPDLSSTEILRLRLIVTPENLLNIQATRRVIETDVVRTASIFVTGGRSTSRQNKHCTNRSSFQTKGILTTYFVVSMVIERHKRPHVELAIFHGSAID